MRNVGRANDTFLEIKSDNRNTARDDNSARWAIKLRKLSRCDFTWRLSEVNAKVSDGCSGTVVRCDARRCKINRIFAIFARRGGP